MGKLSAKSFKGVSLHTHTETRTHVHTPHASRSELQQPLLARSCAAIDALRFRADLDADLQVAHPTKKMPIDCAKYYRDPAGTCNVLWNSNTGLQRFALHRVGKGLR